MKRSLVAFLCALSLARCTTVVVFEETAGSSVAGAGGGGGMDAGAETSTEAGPDVEPDSCGTPFTCQLWNYNLPPEAGCESYTAPDGTPCDGGTCANGLCL